jgi:hypothetical protein
MQSTTTKTAVVIADCTDLGMDEQQPTLAADSLAPSVPPIQPTVSACYRCSTGDLPETGGPRTRVPTWSSSGDRSASGIHELPGDESSRAGKARSVTSTAVSPGGLLVTHHDVIESERRRHGGLESAPVVRELAPDQVAP